MTYPNCYLQIHVLWGATAALLNADRKMRQKIVTFGGVPRMAVSSQSFKRATRELFNSAQDPHLVARRSRNYRMLAADVLVENGWDPDIAETVTLTLHQVITGGEGAAMILARADVVDLAVAACEQLREELLDVAAPEKPGRGATEKEKEQYKTDAARIEKKRNKLITKKQIRAMLKSVDNVDIALHGRMIAANAYFNVDAGVAVATARGVEAFRPGSDDFTAVEEFPHPNRPAEAGMIETRERGSAILYRYAVVDLAQLVKNLPDTGYDQIVSYTADWATAFVNALPTAAWSSTAPTSRPSMVMLHAAPHGMGNLYDKAFAKPVSHHDGDDRDYHVAAANRIVTTFTEDTRWFGRHGTARALMPAGVDLPENSGIVLADSFDAMVTDIGDDLRATA